MTEDTERRWQRLTRLLEPVYDRAAITARNLERTPHDGDDLFQETVLRAHAKLPSLREEAQFRSWFFAVMLSIHRSRARRSFWRRFLPLDAPEAAAAADETADDPNQAAASRRASQALASLPAVQREAVVLHDMEGFSVAEVAEAQGASEAAVKSRLVRGRKRMRRFYHTRGWAAARAGQASGPGWRPLSTDPIGPGGNHD
jgi:RNA polymerase sigma-70 factor (ECF subfamily)